MMKTGMIHIDRGSLDLESHSNLGGMVQEETVDTPISSWVTTDELRLQVVEMVDHTVVTALARTSVAAVDLLPTMEVVAEAEMVATVTTNTVTIVVLVGRYSA